MGRSPADGIDLAALPAIAVPPKPTARGTGVFVASGILFATAVGEYIAAHVLLKRQCLQALALLDPLSEETGEEVTACSASMLQAAALKLHGSINALASVGVAAAGGSIRARHDAHRDVFESGRHHQTQNLRTAGAAMLGVGLFTWLGSAAGTWASTVACDDLDCVERLRGAQTALTLSSFALVTVGTGVLTYGLLYERRYAENATIYGHIQRLQLLTTARRGQVGVHLVGQF
ncbi:MAG: hypothetical protein B7733_01485 [Myxococcales bacterium FL481]|nr:MAG: hypothetical protein B7733_01485 [Myxococcales bacterium FL481]